MSKKLLCALLVISLLALPLVGCTKPVTLTIHEPKDEVTVTESPVEVRAWVSDAKATVWVNGAIVTVTKYAKGKAGAVSTMIDLKEGENIITFNVAQGEEGKWKNVVARTVTVIYTPSE